MHDTSTTIDGGTDRAPVRDIADGQFDTEALQFGRVTGGADEGPQGQTGRSEATDQMPTDEASGTGNKDGVSQVAAFRMDGGM